MTALLTHDLDALRFPQDGEVPIETDLFEVPETKKTGPFHETRRQQKEPPQKRRKY
jgi:hypothetical protein